MHSMIASCRSFCEVMARRFDAFDEAAEKETKI